MFQWRRKREKERAEAEGALKETREQNARIKAKSKRDKGLFDRIGEIRRENHIADAVGRLMEGR